MELKFVVGVEVYFYTSNGIGFGVGFCFFPGSLSALVIRASPVRFGLLNT